MKQNEAKSISGPRPGPRPADAARRNPNLRQRLPAEPEIPQGEMTPRVRSAVMGLMQELDRLKDELSAANERVSQLESMADEDPLVPVLNRRGFERELERAIAYVGRYDSSASLVYVDLDDLKKINDVHGHAVGDAALRRLADFLVTSVRRSDLVGRLGGDEFALVLHRADAAAAESKAMRMAEEMAAQPLRHNGFEIALGVSIGCVELRADDTVAGALTRADRAMYRDKARRKGDAALRR